MQRMVSQMDYFLAALKIVFKPLHVIRSMDEKVAARLAGNLQTAISHNDPELFHFHGVTVVKTAVELVESTVSVEMADLLRQLTGHTAQSRADEDCAELNRLIDQYNGEEDLQLS